MHYSTNLFPEDSEPCRERRLSQDSGLLINQLPAIDNRRLAAGSLARLPVAAMREVYLAIADVPKIPEEAMCVWHTHSVAHEKLCLRQSRRRYHYVEDIDEAAFLQNELAQDGVIRNVEIIGEASRNIEQRHPAFAVEHPELPLAFAYQMRNAVAHGYFKVDLEIFWKTIQNDLPKLPEQIKKTLGDLERSGDGGSATPKG